MLETIDGIKKGWQNVIGYLMIALIVLIGQGFQWGVGSIQKGEKAYNEIPVIKARQDTLEIHCAKKAFEDALFKQEISQKLKYYDEGQQEIKGDLKWMRENWNQKK